MLLDSQAILILWYEWLEYVKQLFAVLNRMKNPFIWRKLDQHNICPNVCHDTHRKSKKSHPRVKWAMPAEQQLWEVVWWTQETTITLSLCLYRAVNSAVSGH